MRLFDPNGAPASRAAKRKKAPAGQPRPYDPAVDGWNAHRLRHTPSVDQMLYRRDEAGEDF